MPGSGCRWRPFQAAAPAPVHRLCRPPSGPCRGGAAAAGTSPCNVAHNASGSASRSATRCAPWPAALPGALPAFAEVTREAKRADGYLPVWTRDDKTWLEVPAALLDQPMFFGSSLAGGLGETQLEAAFRLPFALDRGNSSIERARSAATDLAVTLRQHFVVPKLPVPPVPAPGAPLPNPAALPNPPAALPDARSLFLSQTLNLAPLPSPLMPRWADTVPSNLTTPATTAFAQRLLQCSHAEETMDQAQFGFELLAEHGLLDPAGPEAEACIASALKNVTMHEIGHALGLRHNFRASAAGGGAAQAGSGHCGRCARRAPPDRIGAANPVGQGGQSGARDEPDAGSPGRRPGHAV